MATREARLIHREDDEIWTAVKILDDQTWAYTFSEAARNGRLHTVTYNIGVASVNEPNKSTTRTFTLLFQYKFNATFQIEYATSHSQFINITKAIKSIAFACDSPVALDTQNTRLMNFLKLNYENCLSKTLEFTLDGDELFEEDASQIVIQIGASVGHSRALVKKLSFKAGHSTGLNNNTLTAKMPIFQQEIISFYLNCLLSIVPTEIHKEIVEKLTAVVLQGKIEFFKMDSTEYQTVKDVRLSRERVMFCALIGGTAFVKQGKLYEEILPWCKNRTDAMFATARMETISVPTELVAELPVIADYLSLHIDIRAAILSPILSLVHREEAVSNPMYTAVQRQISVATKDYAMSTLENCYWFHQMYDTDTDTLYTEAHTLYSQATTLATHYKELQKKYTTTSTHLFAHHCVIHDQPTWMKASSYPDLAFCAQLKIKAMKT